MCSEEPTHELEILQEEYLMRFTNKALARVEVALVLFVLAGPFSFFLLYLILYHFIH